MAHVAHPSPPPVRDRILDAALAQLREGGIRHLTQVRVARRAGVRQSHVTYYFPTRRDLMAAATSRFVDGLTAGLAALAASRPANAPEEILRHLGEVIAEDSHMRMFLGLVVATEAEPALRDILIQGTRRLESGLARLLGDAAPERARAALAALWGVGLYRYTIHPAARDDPTDSVLAGLGPGAPRLRTPSRTSKARNR